MRLTRLIAALLLAATTAAPAYAQLVSGGGSSGGAGAPSTNPPGGTGNYAPIASPIFTGSVTAPTLNLTGTSPALTFGGVAVGGACAANSYATSLSTSLVPTCSAITSGNGIIFTGGTISIVSPVSVANGGLGSVAITPAAGMIPVALNATNYVARTISGDATLSSTGVLTVASVNGQAGPFITASAGSVTDAQLANAYSGVGACAAGSVATTLTRNAAPTCTAIGTVGGGVFLPLTGGTLSGPGNLTVTGTLTQNGSANFNSGATISFGLTLPNWISVSGTSALSGAVTAGNGINLTGGTYQVNGVNFGGTCTGSQVVTAISTGVIPTCTVLTSTALSDYATGPWTPALNFGGAAVGLTGTQTGTYVRVGKFVHAQFNIVLTAKGTSTGVVTISGLPVAANATVKDVSGHCDYAAMNNLANPTTSIVFFQPTLNATNGNINMVTGNGTTTLNDTFFSNTSALSCSTSYVTI